MSLYKSSAILTNTTNENITIGSLIIPAESSVTFWNTINNIQQSVLSVFNIVREYQSDLALLINDGTVQAVKDDLVLDQSQFLTVIMLMSTAIDNATNLLELSSPIDPKPTQSDGIPMTVQAPRRGSDWVVGSHNFCDKCSWFQDSIRVTGEVLQDSGDGYAFISNNNAWIDMTSGRQHNESFWIKVQQEQNPSNPHGYQPRVYIDGYEAVKREPFETTGGDYEVIYESGQIVFFTNQSGKVITADYSYPNTSYFHVSVRTPGTILVIEDAEADVSLDAVMNDDIVYSWWFDIGGGTWIQLGEYSYSRMGQIATEARGTYPVFKATGSTAADKELPLPEFRRKSRGMRSDRQATPFNYITVRPLPAGAEMRIYTRHHREQGGEHVSITLYCSETSA